MNKLIMTFDEPLDIYSVPSSEDFTVTVNADTSYPLDIDVKSVAVANGAVSLELPYRVTEGTITLKYTAPSHAGAKLIQDWNGNVATSFAGVSLDRLAPWSNSPATGLPIITGSAIVGETLAADTSGIDDADGHAEATFSYQWISNDGTGYTDIVGAGGFKLHTIVL